MFASQAAGTPAFMAPELFAHIDDGQYDGFAADVYSLGATLYTLVVGHPPFMARNETELASLVTTQDVKIPRCLLVHCRCQRGCDLMMKYGYMNCTWTVCGCLLALVLGFIEGGLTFHALTP